MTEEGRPGAAFFLSATLSSGGDGLLRAEAVERDIIIDVLPDELDRHADLDIVVGRVDDVGSHAHLAAVIHLDDNDVVRHDIAGRRMRRVVYDDLAIDVSLAAR